MTAGEVDAVTQTILDAEIDFPLVSILPRCLYGPRHFILNSSNQTGTLRQIRFLRLMKPFSRILKPRVGHRLSITNGPGAAIGQQRTENLQFSYQ